MGMTTMIVTNGSKLTPEYLDSIQSHTDWITLSIDSVIHETQKEIGRAVNGKPISAEDYLHIAQLIKERNIRLKLNTVVNRFNCMDNMSDFVIRLQPERWKLFQVLPIKGQNCSSVNPFLISKQEFDYFVAQHLYMEQLGIAVVPEDNDAMTGSYVMIDPAGRFFDNVSGELTYGRPILEVGVKEALEDITYDFTKFINRGGIYEWKNQVQGL